MLIAMTGGCQVLRPDPIPRGPYIVDPALSRLDDQPIEKGRPHRVLDSVGWVVGIPSKLLLWDRRIDNHKISGPTLAAAADYMAASELGHVKVRANQYAPLKDWQRLRANKSMHWLARYTLGIVSLGQEAIVPGRVFGGDHFNPYTQTVHLYSDVPAIAWHELAHAKDFSRRDSQAIYSLSYGAVPLWHETIASQDVMSFVADRGDRSEIADTIKILYPAYGTYVGSAGGLYGGGSATPIFYGTVIVSHFNARQLAKRIERGDNVGPLTALASQQTPSVFMGDATWQTTVGTTFRDPAAMQGQAVVAAATTNFQAMHHDNRLRLVFPDQSRQTVGTQTTQGVNVRIDVGSMLDMPVTLAYQGQTGDQSVYWTPSPTMWATTTLGRYNAESELDRHELDLAYRFDANLLNSPLDRSSDEIQMGLKYLYQNDTLQEDYNAWTSGYGWDAYLKSYEATNHVLASTIRFQRRYERGPWSLIASTAGFAGLNVAQQTGEQLDHVASRRQNAASLYDSQTTRFVTGQTGQLSAGVRLGSFLSLRGGVIATRIENLVSSVRDLPDDSEDDANTMRWIGGFGGAEIEF